MNYYNNEIARITANYFPKPATIEPVIRIRRMIDASCCEPVDFMAIASEACLSGFHAARLFKRCYGCAPHQYLIDRRIQEAIRLLREGATVQTACFQTGFHSVTSFAALFRRKTGQAPSAWRKMRKIR